METNHLRAFSGAERRMSETGRERSHACLRGADLRIGGSGWDSAIDRTGITAQLLRMKAALSFATKATAIVVLAIGAMLTVGTERSLFVRACGLGLFLLVLSVQARGRKLSGLPAPSGRLWTCGIVSAFAALAAYHFLYHDALSGYRQVWPVYTFSAAALGAIGIWAAIASRLI